MPSSGSTGSSQTEFGQMWQRQLIWWHVWFAVGLVSTVAATAASTPGPRGRLPEVVLLCVVGVMYAAVGAPGVIHDRPRWSAAYLVVAWAALLGCAALNPHTSAPIMFFVLFPQLWSVVSTPRTGVVASVVVVGIYGLLGWRAAEPESDAVLQVVATSVFSLALSLGLGLFIVRLVHEASSRAATIDALREAQERLAAAERDRGVSDERERLSREIHDTLAQGFTSVLSLSRAATSALRRGDLTVVAERLALLESTALDNLREARLIVAELTPGHLQSRTLVAALERLAAALGHESGLEVGLDVVGTPRPLGGSVDVLVFRSAQEALANVRRHAQARTVQMSLDYSLPTLVRLRVADDGVGFDPDDRATTSGFGLDGLRGRVAAVGGDVDVSSGAGLGTILTVAVPDSPASTRVTP